MKKAYFSVLIIITALFAVFLLGFFLGRNIGAAPVQISARISDGPTVVTTAPTEMADPEETVVFPININTASAQQLTALPGIGEVLAQRIVDHRNLHGEFTIPEELMNVSGISEKRFEAIQNLIITED